ncbi:AAA family ATPase [Sulfurovum sp.]|uniref:AAA family ATPase n=1 Tax=Sulfurovum sp. TaxID=1969726 RepID=UPI0025DCF3E6|nr:AAA family ATPase [Sulfurovum sp.]
MELVYLWVEEYKNIKNQGFNFSPKFNCDYDGETLTIKDNVDKKGNKLYIENFFGDNINVTAIVGKNGSGKTNLLDLVSHPVAKKQFIIFSDNTYFYFSGIAENISKIPIAEVLKSRFKKIVFGNKISSIEALTTIYYNNILTIDDKDKCFPSSIGEFHKNIGITRRIYAVNNKNVVTAKEDSFLSIYKQFNIAKSQNLQNTISLLQNQTINLPFSIPKRLKIEVMTFAFEDNKLINEHFQNLNTTFSFNSFSDNVKGAILNNFFAYKLSIDIILKLEIKEKIKQAFHHQTMTGFYTEISNLFLQERWIKQENYKEQLNPYIDIFLKANQFLDLIKNFHIQGSRIWYIEIKDIPDNFINLYELVVGAGVEFLRFSFSHELSDGEENFLSFFATLNEKKLLKYTDTAITKNIVLLIDEGELTLHPEWQKKYIKYIVDFVKNNFSNYTVHLIFTTHSPFLLSDLPKQNIIFIDKDKNGNCKVVDGLNDKQQTFGQNIHTLLSDSFFMEDGLMGEFAKGKINEIIRFHNLTKKNRHKSCLQKIYDKREEGFRQTQSIIGDSYLQQVLENHLLEIDKFFDKKIAKAKLKTRLEKQLAELEDD